MVIKMENKLKGFCFNDELVKEPISKDDYVEKIIKMEKLNCFKI